MSVSRGCLSAAFASLFLIAFLATRADAFEYKEHRDVSNEGFARARRFIEQEYAACTAACCVKEFRSFDGESPFSSKTVTFGDLVALVDYVTDPNDFLYRRGFNPDDPNVGLNFLNEDLVRTLTTNTFQALHAAHNDRNHFQDRALSSFWTWHRVARQVASAGDVRLALVYSAFSVHFLEDFFAPGHIRAPRSSLHDAAAMNIHDRFNKRGQCFIVDPDHLAEIGPPFLSPAEFQEIQTKGSLFLRGDGGLGHPKDDNRLQATFLAAVVGRAIADVLESYLDGRADEKARSSCPIKVLNHFDEWKWGPYEVATKPASETCSGKPPSYPLIDWLGIAKTVSPLACIRYGCYDRITDTLPLGVTTVLAIDAGPQSLLGANATSRAQGELSVGPIILLTPSQDWRDGKGTIGILKGAPQLFGGLEWNHAFARGYNADGVRARAYLPLTSVDLQLTASGTYRWYRGTTSDGGRWSWDGGLQFGFGLVFTGLCIGRQHAVDETDGRLKPVWVLTGNLTLMVSPSIVTKIGNDHEVTFDKRE